MAQLAQSAYGVSDGGPPLASVPATIVAVTVQTVAELGYEAVRTAYCLALLPVMLPPPATSFPVVQLTVAVTDTPRPSFPAKPAAVPVVTARVFRPPAGPAGPAGPVAPVAPVAPSAPA